MGRLKRVVTVEALIVRDSLARNNLITASISEALAEGRKEDAIRLQGQASAAAAAPAAGPAGPLDATLLVCLSLRKRAGGGKRLSGGKGKWYEVGGGKGGVE